MQRASPPRSCSYLGLKSGMNVLDLFGANTYWAEISSAVVGPKGHVTVWNPSQFYSDKRKQAFEAFMATHPNVSIVTSPFEAADLPKDYADWVILNDNYHDTYWESEKLKIPQMDPNAFLKAVYASMKPGGVIGVIDHVASPNSDTRATVEKYHRIDPEVVKADFKRAGFVFLGSSDILRNPADDHSTEVSTRRSPGRPTASFSSSRSRVERSDRPPRRSRAGPGAGSAPIGHLRPCSLAWDSARRQTDGLRPPARLRWALPASLALCGSTR